ncbi:MAG: gamma-glutamylcyclotransferase [Prolixibacteraceae bacterium]|nr:gamma-glutamylcyclotransferase [Prolixibacteraceae bacterium]
MESLFVYGTLCFSEITEKLTGKHFKTECAVLKGYRRRRVAGADYPAIVVDSQSEVDGIILKDVDKRSMEIISFYEGEDYSIERLKVTINSQLIEVNVFVWNSAISELQNEDWDGEYFMKNSFSVYIKEIIPATLNEFMVFFK